MEEYEDEDEDGDEEYYEEENEEDKDPTECDGTPTPAYTMYGVSDAHDDFDRRCNPTEDFDEYEHDVEHLPDFETDNEYKTDEGGPDSELPWASQFHSMSFKVVAKLSTTSKGIPVARVQKKTAALTLTDFDSSDMDSDVASVVARPSPARFRKNQDDKDEFPTRMDENTRYLTRSRAATTTGAPEGGCSP